MVLAMQPEKDYSVSPEKIHPPKPQVSKEEFERIRRRVEGAHRNPRSQGLFLPLAVLFGLAIASLVKWLSS